MELNTEIEKVIGTEIAKLFATTITEEEMMKKAQEVWGKINKDTNSWGTRIDSELEIYIKQTLLKRIHEKIYEILEEPENEKSLEERAREMVTKAKQIADEAIVKAVAERIVDNTLNVYNSNAKFVQDVMAALHIIENNKR